MTVAVNLLVDEFLHQSTGQIITHPGHPYTQALMNAVRLSPKGGNENIQTTAQTERTEPLLNIEGITAAYGRIIKLTVLRDINISIGLKEVVGIIGESGCGKSTLARVISGLMPPEAGTLHLDQKELPGSVKGRTRDDLRRVQIVFQMADVALNPRQTVTNILGRPLQFYHGLDRAQCSQRAGELLTLVELPEEFASRYPGNCREDRNKESIWPVR